MLICHFLCFLFLLFSVFDTLFFINQRSVLLCKCCFSDAIFPSGINKAQFMYHAVISLQAKDNQKIE